MKTSKINLSFLIDCFKQKKGRKIATSSYLKHSLKIILFLNVNIGSFDYETKYIIPFVFILIKLYTFNTMYWN